MEFIGLLKHGTVNSIMNNEEVEDPVIQILSFKKLTAERKADRYRLMISDGQNCNSFVLLSTKLNGMIYSGEITEFVIVKLKAYHFATKAMMERRQQVLVISNLCVLRYGYYVGFKIGNPMSSTSNSDKVVGDRSKTLDSATERNHSTIIKYEEILTKGALNSIMNDEEVKDAVIQVLDTKKIYDNGLIQRYRLLISDGQNLSSFALLGRNLNNIIYSGELTQFTIFQIKHYTYTVIALGYKPIMFITGVNVLINGHSVGSKIGDPKVIINYADEDDVVSYNTSIINEIYFDFSEICKDSDRLFIVEYEQMLTTGSLESIMNREIVESCMQVLKIDKIINCWNNEIYLLTLSDGHISSSFVILSSYLNDMVITGILGQFSFIRIIDHIITDISISGSETSMNVMIINNLCTLVPGEVVGLKIGNPKSIISPENDTEYYNALLSKCAVSIAP